MEKISYREGYKFQLAADYRVLTPIRPPKDIVHEFFTLRTDGTLKILRGYAWDGATGAPDFKSSMRPSLVHDVFCQAMRARLLDYDIWQDKVNALFRQHCIEDGMWPWRAKLWYAAVEFANAGDPSQGESNPVKQAPC